MGRSPVHSRRRYCLPNESPYSRELFRLAANGRWVPDDHRPGLAFYGRCAGIMTVWAPVCECAADAWCPKVKAERAAKAALGSVGAVYTVVVPECLR